MSIDVKTFEKSIEEVLNWIGEIEGRLETVEDDISQVDTNVSDLDYEVTEMRNEEVDSIKRINYFIDSKVYFSHIFTIYI